MNALALLVLVACDEGHYPPKDDPGASGSPTSDTAAPTGTVTPTPDAAPVLLPWTDPADHCGGVADCVNFADLPLVWSGYGGGMLRDLTGDGVPDLVAQNAAFPYPPPGGLPTTATAWWDHGNGVTLFDIVDLDGDGRVDLDFAEGWYLGPFAGHVTGGFDVPATVVWGDLTGDGIPDLWDREPGTGTIRIFAGPLPSESDPPWLTVTYDFDPEDPDLSLCFWSYGFFDSENSFTLRDEDILGGPEPELQIVSNYLGCPLATPFLVQEGGSYVISKDDLGGLAATPDITPLPDMDGDGVDDSWVALDAEPVHSGRAELVDGKVVLGPAIPGDWDLNPWWLVPDVDGDGIADAVETYYEDDVVLHAGDGHGHFDREILRISAGDYLWISPVGDGWWTTSTNDASAIFRWSDLL